MAKSTKKSLPRTTSKNPKRARAKTSEGAPPTRVKLALSDSLFKLLGVSEDEVQTLTSFMKLKDQEKIEASRRVIQDCIIKAIEPPDARFPLAVAESESLLTGYATLDDPHRLEIQRLIKQITSYLRDSTRKRPFNVLMLAEPGAGKSHFIKQLAKSMVGERVQAVTFNMANMQSPDDMAQPVDELRNLKVNDRFPLLFLDEFDSDPRHYAALLPLLWDGELQIGHRDLKLGKAVIVLAGSNPDLPKVMDHSAKMRLESDKGEGFVPPDKLIDLLSRINAGVINIPDLDLRTEHRDRRVDKVCVAVALIKGRFGDELTTVPRSLLRFIAETTFRYGVRSIAHLIDLIDSNAIGKNKTLKGAALGLPITTEDALKDSSLKLHLLDKDGGFGVVNRWKELSRDKSTVSLNVSPRYQYVWSFYPQ